MYLQCIHFRSESDKFRYDCVIIFIYHQARNFLITKRYTVHVVRRVIARVKSMDIVFHNFVRVFSLEVVYETVGISVLLRPEEKSWSRKGGKRKKGSSGGREPEDFPLDLADCGFLGGGRRMIGKYWQIEQVCQRNLDGR